MHIRRNAILDFDFCIVPGHFGHLIEYSWKSYLQSIILDFYYKMLKNSNYLQNVYRFLVIYHIREASYETTTVFVASS